MSGDKEEQDTSSAEIRPDLKKAVREQDFGRMDSAISAFCQGDIEQAKRLHDAFKRGYDLKQRTEGSQGDRLLAYLEKNRISKYFLSRTSEGYVKTTGNAVGPASVLKIGAIEMKHWLADLFYEEEGKAIGNDTITNVLNVMQARARKSGEIQNLYVRVAPGPGDEIYYDLCNKQHEVVKITSQGWTIEPDMPIMFRRYSVMLSQVYPERGGDVNLFKKYLNLRHEDERDLALICMITDFIPEIPHVLIMCYGPPGSAKTTFSWCWRVVVDPSELEEGLNIPERYNKNDFLQLLAHNYLPCFDNIGELSNWVSDELSKAITGSGIAKRALYTDDDDIVMRFRRPAMINGINPPATNSDLLDRGVIFQLELIDDENRRPEKAFRSEFVADVPTILGGVFDTIVKAMLIYPTMRLSRFPRMADFFQWGCAIAEALNIGGEQKGKNVKRGAERFVELYYKNIERQSEEVLKAKLIAKPLIDFLEEQPKTPLLDKKADQVWSGTPTELVRSFTEYVAIRYEKLVEDKGWPKRANVLMRRINEIEIDLLKLGYKIQKSMDSNTREKGITFLSVSPLRMPENVVTFTPSQAQDAAPQGGLPPGDPKNIDRIDRIDRMQTSKPSTAIDIENDIDRSDRPIDTIDNEKISIGKKPSPDAGSIDTIDMIDISMEPKGKTTDSMPWHKPEEGSDATNLAKLEAYMEKNRSVGILRAAHDLQLSQELLLHIAAKSPTLKCGHNFNSLEWSPEKKPRGEKVESDCVCGTKTIVYPAKDELTITIPCVKCGRENKFGKVHVICTHPTCGVTYSDWFPVNIPWENQRCSMCKQYDCLKPTGKEE